jgi:hypothetical protein
MGICRKKTIKGHKRLGLLALSGRKETKEEKIVGIKKSVLFDPV